MKVTKKARRIFVKEKLRTDKKWAAKGLVRIFQENQTEQEKVYEDTIVENGIGFTGADGNIMSSFAKQYIKRKSLSDKQWKIVQKKMPKYWGQVIEMSDKPRLTKMVSDHLDNTSTQTELKL